MLQYIYFTTRELWHSVTYLMEWGSCTKALWTPADPFPHGRTIEIFKFQCTLWKCACVCVVCVRALVWSLRVNLVAPKCHLLCVFFTCCLLTSITQADGSMQAMIRQTGRQKMCVFVCWCVCVFAFHGLTYMHSTNGIITCAAGSDITVPLLCAFFTC